MGSRGQFGPYWFFPVVVKLTTTESGRQPMNIVPFHFEELALMETCWITGKPYFTRRAIGEWLEYQGRPQKAIDKIVERNPHIKQFSVAVKLTATDGKKYSTDVYDPIGLQLIVFESNQPKAIQFKVDVAHLVYAYMNGTLKPSKWALKDDLMSAAHQIKSLPRGTKRGDLVRDLAERDSISTQTAYRRIGLATGENFKNIKGKCIQRSDKGATKHPGEKEKTLVYAKANPAARGVSIKRALNLITSHDRINVWIREASK